MKVMRIGERGQERPAVHVGDAGYVDVSDVVPDVDERFLGSGALAGLSAVVDERVAAGRVTPWSGERVGAPIARPHQVLCIGLNYADHAAEAGAPIPAEPIVFTKPPNSMVGPDDDVFFPRGATKLDWEVELGVVVGRRCRYLADEEEARDAIAGYVVVNDVSERAWQLERGGGQWGKGKSAETFTPCGPWLVTADEVPDPTALRLWLEVNGKRRQDGSTATMIFTPTFLVHHLSQFLVLEPGDLISTGTPPGVALGLSPSPWLQVGDVVTLGIDGLGSQRQRVVAAP
ncbi:MAG: fumarylacetoacetate hydrolase family protein [Candidatus Nanopelagicales bacterium]